MKILFYFGHPAQYLFLRETIRRLKSDGNYEILILIKTKDVLETLLRADNLTYQNILVNERGITKFAIIASFFKRLMIIAKIFLKEKPNLVVGTDATIAQLGFIFGIKRITITEDDYSVIKTLGRLTYPFTQYILCPNVCNVGRWEKKKIGYEGYMKLGYLHPSIFIPEKDKLIKYKLFKKFVIVRLARLTAHHDFGISGIKYDILDKLIEYLNNKGYEVYISSESSLDKNYEAFKLNIQPEDMHHILSYASLLICDSQSMSVEAAMLGVPSIRYSSFAGKISVLEELEHVFRLTFGITPGDDEKLFKTLGELMSINNLDAEFKERQKYMLSKKINVTEFVELFIKKVLTQ